MVFLGLWDSMASLDSGILIGCRCFGYYGFYGSFIFYLKNAKNNLFMRKIFQYSFAILCALILFSQYVSAQNTEKDSLQRVTTVGIFDGKRTVVGNFETAEVYLINEYCIALSDLTDSLALTLKGKKIMVSGVLNIVVGKTFPAKTSTDGTIYEPYIEPDKKYINQPVFSIVWDSREPQLQK
jgi:hypothetical protein